MWRAWTVVAGALLLGGCARTSPPAVAQVTPASTSVEEVTGAQHQSFVELAAADARFAKRLGVKPSAEEVTRGLQASLAQEELARLLGGVPDPFTRAPRERALARARQRVAAMHPVDPAARAALAAWSVVLHEEEARLMREQLPVGAARLIRALASVVPVDPGREVLEDDTTLSQRLGQIEDSLSQADSLDGDAIEDALDALEPQLTPYQEATRALTSLRLAAAQPLAPAKGPRALTAPPPERRQWSQLRAQLKQELLGPRSAQESVREDERERRAAELLFESAGDCPAAHKPAQLAPSIERRFGCAALAAAQDDALLLQIVVHDLLTFGLWALELAEERAEYRRVLSSHATQGHVAPELGAKLARRAAAEPELALRAGALGASLAAVEPAQRAAWIAAYLAGGAFLASELILPQP